MAIREGKWDCPQCGKKGNRGGDLKCPDCGRIRSNEIKFYVDDAAAAVTDEKALERAKAGADWICDFCGGITPAAMKACKNCGADRTENKREVKVIPNQPAAATPPPPSAPKKSNVKLWATVGLAVAAGLFFLCRTSVKEATVERVAWERTVEIERYATLHKEAWRDKLPSAARVTSTETRMRNEQIGTRPVTRTVSERVQTGTRQVKTGTRDLGNGYFEDVYSDEPVYETRQRQVVEQEPVYGDVPREWCRYDIDEWVKDHTERASGADLSPKWPEYSLTGSSKLREGKKTEKYSAWLKMPDGEVKAWEDAPQESWKKLALGKPVKVELRLGSVIGLAEK